MKKHGVFIGGILSAIKDMFTKRVIQVLYYRTASTLRKY